MPNENSKFQNSKFKKYKKDVDNSYEHMYNTYCCDDAWLSLVERCVRDAEVAGSNPVASIWRVRGNELFFCTDKDIVRLISSHYLYFDPLQNFVYTAKQRPVNQGRCFCF